MSEQETGFDPSRRMRSMRGGQDYLDVKWRWVWLDDDTSAGMDAAVGYVATSECLQISDTFALFKATVRVMDANGVVIRETTGHGSETKGDFGDYIEKAETKAFGRALQHLGYGSAAAADDGQRLADSPVDRRGAAPAARPAQAPASRPAPQAAPPRQPTQAPAQAPAPAAARGRRAADAPPAASVDRLADTRSAAAERDMLEQVPTLRMARFPGGVDSDEQGAAMAAWLRRYDADGWRGMFPRVQAILAASTLDELQSVGREIAAAGISDDDLRACWQHRRDALGNAQPSAA